MPRFIDYNPPTNVVKDVEIPSLEGESYTLRVRRTKEKLVVESISDPFGRVASTADLVRDCRISVKEIRAIMSKAFEE